MSFFRSAKERHIAGATEELFYGMADQELTSGNVSTGLFAKAKSEGGGDAHRTNTAYLKLRVHALQVEYAALREGEAERMAAQAMGQRMAAPNTQTEKAPQKRSTISPKGKEKYVSKRAWIFLSWGFFTCGSFIVIESLSGINMGPFFIPSLFLIVIFHYLWARYKNKRKSSSLKKWTPPT